MSDEESTQEIDVDALRARARSSIRAADDADEGPHDRETYRGPAVPGANAEDRTVMQPPRQSKRARKETAPTNPGPGNKLESVEIEIEEPIDAADDDVEDVSDDEDVALITNEGRDQRQLVGGLRERAEAAQRYLAEIGQSEPEDPEGRLPHLSMPDSDEEQPDDARSMIGTMPGHDVAQALRAMMGDVPDSLPHGDEGPDEDRDSTSAPHWERPGLGRQRPLDEGDTVTRMPAARDLGLSADWHAVDTSDNARALGTTSEDDALPAFSLDDALDEPEPAAPHTEYSAQKPMRPPLDSFSETHTSTSARQALSLLPESTAITRATGGQDLRGEIDNFLETTRATNRALEHFPDPDELPQHPSMRPPMDTLAVETQAATQAAPEAEDLPRFSLHSMSDVPSPLTEHSPVEPITDALPDETAGYDEPPALPIEPEPALDDDSVDIRVSSPDVTDDLGDDERTSIGRMAVTEPPPIEPEDEVRDEMPSQSLSLDDADIEEIVAEEVVETNETTAGVDVVMEAPPVMEVQPERVSYRPPPPVAKSVPPPAGVSSGMDPEEKELFNSESWSLLVQHYRNRLGATDGPNKKAAILVKIAHVFEKHLQDPNETFNTLIDAFETAPENEEVVAALDRVAKDQQRIGELADRVKKRLVPGATDEKRVAYLAHVVFWYERMLSRGSEVSPLVSDIERHDKVHPLVLKRAAQIAAMNGDVKTQREYLARALERTFRVAEKVTIHLALASAWAGTPDAVKHYELAVQLDPSSIVALQGLKRLGKEKEAYPIVKWALERQAEVAQTEAERIDAMLELAELEETKFLKRELAAQLLEQVLALESSHPQALKGLERCYHALRDWPALARILALRADHVFEKKAKVELFELAAEVHESKLGDPAGAIDVYKNLLLVEPKHRRALTDLARLSEKLGDWDNVALYKSRIAEMAPTKRASSQELVKLGDYLNTPERDPLAAKLQFEKAVQIDPTNAVAWEAIQKIANENGDLDRVLECLEQRKKHTDIPRQRAVVLVELAKVQLSLGDDDAAQKSYEAAIRADSSNEAAAVAMLDAYTSDERWAEAAPLCELLVNAAIRDRDTDALFIRLRLQTRIAAALGDAERALTASMSALDARPGDLGAQADLLAVASQCSGSPTLQRAKEHLLRIVELLDDLTNEQLIKLAILERELKDLDAAARCFEAGRRREPDNVALTRQLADIYFEQADYPRACKLKVDLARSSAGTDSKFELLVEAGEIWAKKADELEKAATLFEEARQIKPDDASLLSTLKWLYTELQDWEMLAGVLDDQIQSEPDANGANAARKLETVLALSELYREKINDPLRASDILEVALDLDRKRLDLFEGLVRSLTEAKDWDRLERSYRRMIARVKDDDEQQLMFLLFQQLGLIYRDRLGDASRAFDALDAASRLEPDNAEVRKIVIELLIVTDNLDNAVSRVREEIDRDPHQPDLYAELYELFLRQHFFDKAWCCVNVLSRLTTPSADQRRFHEDYSPMPLDRVPGQIVEQAWKSHVFHQEMDPALTNILSLLTPAVARMRFGQLRPEQRVGRPFTQNHSKLANQIKETFDNACEILAIESPELLVADLNSIHPFAPALAPFGSVLVCGPAIEAQSVSLVYLVGKKLAEQRPELTARAFFPADKELSTILASAMRVARNEKEASGVNALDAGLAAAFTPEEIARLRAAMMQALADNTSFDVKRWLQLADLSSMRAGLLIAGDIEPARQAIGCEVAAASDLSPRDKLGELLKFAVSDLYSDLRGAIGVAVQA